MYFFRKSSSSFVQDVIGAPASMAVRVFREKDLYLSTSVGGRRPFSTSSHQDNVIITSSPPELHGNGSINVIDRSTLQLSIDKLLKYVASRQQSKPMPLVNSDGKSWDKSSFCHRFLIDTFPSAIPMCSKEGTSATYSMSCYGSELDPAHMATCTLRNLAVQPRLLYQSIERKFDKEGTIFLINDQGTSCPSPTLEFISKKLEKDDYQLRLLNKIMTSGTKPSSLCDVWINKTAIFFVNEKYHIYFRMIEYYSVHKVLWDLRVNEGEYVVVRISTNEGMMFPEFDDALFPGAINLKDLPQNATVCFRKVVTTPRCFSSIPFRTKMNGRIRNNCFRCSGQGLTGTPFYSFRKRVIKACNLSDEQPRIPGGSIVVVSRKPYVRYPSDEFKRFERVLTNENNLVKKLNETFRTAEVSVIHLESLPICEQIRYAHSADVMTGVHGAGLVHFWWLRDSALAYEMEPNFEVGNPTFKMLTTLTGRKYKSIRIKGQMKSVAVDVDKVAKELLDSGVVGYV